MNILPTSSGAGRPSRVRTSGKADAAVSVIICTHNPKPETLTQTLGALQAQSLEVSLWELIIVDNGSSEPVKSWVDSSWHPGARIVREERLGLTYARLSGYHAARGEIIVFVDDDNLLAPDYLRTVLSILTDNPRIGAAGGKVTAQYEIAPPQWFAGMERMIACRNLGKEVLVAEWASSTISERRYPECAPIGAGMVVRRAAFASYVENVSKDSGRLLLDRAGTSLASGGDNDIVMSVLQGGWHVAYLPALELQHIIPPGRLTPTYLARMAYSSMVTWIAVLGLYGIRPWTPIPKWTVPLRKIRAYFRLKPWAGPAQLVRWKSACGLFEGRAKLSQ